MMITMEQLPTEFLSLLDQRPEDKEQIKKAIQEAGAEQVDANCIYFPALHQQIEYSPDGLFYYPAE